MKSCQERLKRTQDRTLFLLVSRPQHQRMLQAAGTPVEMLLAEHRQTLWPPRERASGTDRKSDVDPAWLLSKGACSAHASSVSVSCKWKDAVS